MMELWIMIGAIILAFVIFLCMIYRVADIDKA